MSRLQTAQPATRKGNKARLALCGPTGSGKTYTALEAATVFIEDKPDGKIVLFDSERGSASLYADKYRFDHVDWTPPYDPVELAQDVVAAGETYDVVIIDSASHFWMGEGGTLDIVNAAAAKMFSGNQFSGWKEGTPAQNLMVEAFLACKAHVIVTMRSKMEYILVENEKGRQVPQKVGMEPVQRSGIEYEFTVVGDMDTGHSIYVSKSRCDELADKTFRRGQSKNLSVVLRDWLEGNEDIYASPDVVSQLRTEISELPEEKQTRVREAWKMAGLSSLSNLLVSDVESVERLIADAKTEASQTKDATETLAIQDPTETASEAV